MKRTAVFCLCLCLLLSACKTPEIPEDPSEPEESEAVSAVEDPNALSVRADLEDFLTEDLSAEGPALYWLTSERAEAIRERVKQLKTPVLTEEDVLRLAGKAISFYFSAWQEGRTVEMPACGVLADFRWETHPPARSMRDCVSELLAYTLYLFTPPDYVFRESDVGRAISSEEHGASSSAQWWTHPGFYLALAGAGSTPLEAISSLSGGRNGLELQFLELARGDSPLDLRHLEGLALLGGDGEEKPLTLLDLALGGDLALPEGFGAAYAGALVKEWIDYLCEGAPNWEESDYRISGTERLRVSVLLTPEETQAVRKLVRLLPSPVLTPETVGALVAGLYALGGPRFSPILLPGLDGEVDVLLPVMVASYTEQMYLPDIYTHLLNLFTPPDCRYTDLFDRSGRYFALDGEPARFALVTKELDLYLAEETGGVEPVYLAEEDIAE